MEFVTSPFAIRTVLWWFLGKTGTESALFAVVRRRSDDRPSVREFILRPHRTFTARTQNIILSVDRQFVIKIFAPFRQCYLLEKAALEFAKGKLGIETPVS